MPEKQPTIRQTLEDVDAANIASQSANGPDAPKVLPVGWIQYLQHAPEGLHEYEDRIGREAIDDLSNVYGGVDS